MATKGKAVLGALSFNGQRCTALKLFLVDEVLCAPVLAHPAGQPSIVHVQLREMLIVVHDI